MNKEAVRKERKLAYDKRFRKTAKGKASRKLYDQSPKGKAKIAAYGKRYRESVHGKAMIKQYQASGRGEAAQRRYRESSGGIAVRKRMAQSLEGIAMRRRYDASAKGKASKKRSNAKRLEIINFLTNVKIQFGCCACGCSDYWALEFHHVHPEEKLFNVSMFLIEGTWEQRIERLLKEIAKCEIMCANCHKFMTCSY